MSNTPIEIGVTGGIGSGKSVVCRIFESLGVPVYNSDDRARWLMNNNDTIRQKVTTLFGEEAYQDNGLNRDHVARLAYDNPDLLKELNKTVHPLVGQDYKQWVMSKDHQGYVIKEAAIIFESGAYKRLQKIITVSAPESLRINRVLLRDHFRTREEVQKIISKQLSEDERRQRSDYEIINDDHEMIIPQVLTIHNQLSDMAH